MAEPPGGETSTSSKWLWMSVIVLLFLVLLFWFLDPLGNADNAQPASTPVSGWTAAPEGRGVEVNLPESRLKQAPQASPAPATTPAR